MAAAIRRLLHAQRAHARTWLRVFAVCLLVVLAVGGIPGASLRPVVHDLVAPPVPRDVKDRDGIVEAMVRDSASGAAITGAHVRALAIVDGRAYLADSRDTDAAGRAHLAGLPRGETWLMAEASGHARGSSHVVLVLGTREVVVELGPEHAVDVVAKDELGRALADAEIEVAAPGDPLPVGARTGADGVAHVGRLGAGPWRVTARAPGLEEGSERAAHDGDRVTVVLRKLGAIVVHVAAPDGGAAVGARVAVAGAMLWPARSAETDVQGDVRIGGLAAGIYALRATQGDLVSPIELGVLLARGEEKSLTLHLAPGRWVAVRVTDGDADDAQPIASASVTLAEAGISPFPIEATTDARGRAHLGPIAPGGATLSARADGFVPRSAVPVPDQPPAETRLALVRAGVLVGRVVDARGYPVDGATIEIVGTDPTGAPIFDDPRRARFQSAHFDAMLGGPALLVPAGQLGVMPGPVPPIPHEGASVQRAGLDLAAGPPRSFEEPWVTRDDGTFRASPASPGRVRAIVHHPQYVEAESEMVTLAPGGEAHVDVVMHAGGSLEGRVLDAHDRAVEGARVFVSATRGSLERTTRSASDGTFAFAALPQEVSLTAGVDDDEKQPEVRMSLSIPEAGKKEVTIRLPEPRDPLEVTVVDERDWPVDAAQVSASSLTAESPLRTTAFTDRDGGAKLKRARGVPLRVEVIAPGHAPKVVTTDGNGEALRITLAPAESAMGEVVASRGRDAVVGAEVALYTDLGVRRARTDANGAFSLSELAPGAARMRVRAPGFAPVTRAITIPDSAGRRSYAIPRVELSAEGVVEGEVVDGRGDPVPGARVARDHVPTWLMVGATPEGVAITDARGRFSLRELPEGSVVLEAYAADVGRAHADDVKVVAGRTTVNVRIALTRESGDDAGARQPAASGSVAVTLGETGAPVEVVVVSVVEGSEAERAGLVPGDVLTAVDGAAVSTMDEARAKLSGPLGDDVVVRVRRGDGALVLRVTREAVRR